MASHTKTKHRETLTPSREGGQPAPAYEFLLPDWLREAALAVEAAKRTDPYFGGLVGDLTFNVLYGLPPGLRRSYGGADAVIHVKLRRGSVWRLDAGAESAASDADVRVTLEYSVAKELFRGGLKPASTFLSGRVQAQPVNGFRAFPKIAARSLVTAGRALRAAGSVSTHFEAEHPSPAAAGPRNGSVRWRN